MTESDNKHSETRKNDKASSTEVLGLRDLVMTEARVRSGCSKNSTSSCGVNYRSG
jgi:hypothetical protein